MRSSSSKTRDAFTIKRKVAFHAAAVQPRQNFVSLFRFSSSELGAAIASFFERTPRLKVLCTRRQREVCAPNNSRDTRPSQNIIRGAT